jgi:hypothetical protein
MDTNVCQWRLPHAIRGSMALFRALKLRMVRNALRRDVLFLSLYVESQMYFYRVVFHFITW